MPRAIIVPGEYYHVYNRGVNKQKTFLNDFDYARMLFCCIFLQSSVPVYNISSAVSHFIRHRRFNISMGKLENIVSHKTVELTAFALMPNHFHLLVHEKTEGGISRYLQRIEDSYTKYFNLKYKRSGYLFQGPFQSVHVKSNEQLLHLSAYIHKNPTELEKWNRKEGRYPWSSYQDFIKESRWPKLLSRDIVLGQFKDKKEYRYFVETSRIKEPDYFEENY